jgi:uncharacterized membrane protein
MIIDLIQYGHETLNSLIVDLSKNLIADLLHYLIYDLIKDLIHDLIVSLMHNRINYLIVIVYLFHENSQKKGQVSITCPFF